MYHIKKQEIINDQSSINFKEKLQTFLFNADCDVFINKEPPYNKEQMLSTYNNLKEELSKENRFNFDVISMIASYDGSINGWLDNNTHWGKTEYLFNGLLHPSKMEENKSTGLFSGKIAFRKELIEVAIKNGYLTNVNLDNLFQYNDILPLSLKSVLENCPNEVLALGKLRILSFIQSSPFLTKDEVNNWKNTFNSQIEGYSPIIEKPNSLIDHILSIRLFSSNRSKNNPTIK